MKLYRTRAGALIQTEQGANYLLDANWDELINREDSLASLRKPASAFQPGPSNIDEIVLAPIVSQEVWAAGVTYYRSRTARMEESRDAGGGDFYDRVYAAERPELFFKSTASRTVGHGGKVRI